MVLVLPPTVLLAMTEAARHRLPACDNNFAAGQRHLQG